MSIEIKNITKCYGPQKAVDSVSFSISKGELIGFLGPNGAGKSTLIKIITGYLPPTSGEVYLNGELASIDNINIRKTIGYLPEHNPLYTDLYVKEFLEITAGFYRLPNKKKKIAELVDLTGLGDEQHKKIKALSKGYRQRVGLAQALIHDPSILILDEPTTGLDPNQLEEIRKLIKEISKEKTVMLSSHIMQEIEAICSRVLIINKGKIVADGDIENLKKGAIQSNQIVIAKFNKEFDEKILMDVNGVGKAHQKNGSWKIISSSDEDIRPAIFNFAVKNDLIILEMQQKQQNLENVFYQLTQ